jgi:hypothetical protein
MDEFQILDAPECRGDPFKPAFGLSGAFQQLAAGPSLRFVQGWGATDPEDTAPHFHDFLSSSHITLRSARLILVW